DFSRTLRCDLLRSYDTEVSVREPKVVNGLDGVGMRRWTVSVNTNIARPDLPKQRIKLEIASVPAHTSTVRRVAVNYPELAGMYDDLTIRCQTLEEILADKLISFSATDTHIRHRDLWDIPWIVRAQEIDFSAVASLVAAKHADYRCPASLASMIAIGMQRAHVCYADGSFTGQMQRFLSPVVLNRTHDFDNHCDALNTIVEKCFGRVVTSLGISNDVERARRRLATEISLGSISAAVLPKRTLGLS
ncbi:ribosome-binding factor A, partial [Paeniclostridium sordellii]|nr:ribosome-binding factor A [Paeniclostridium sordellii]